MSTSMIWQIYIIALICAAWSFIVIGVFSLDTWYGWTRERQ